MNNCLCIPTAAEKPVILQERAGGPHAAHMDRGRPEGRVAPGCTCYFGTPAASSPFVQCYLPAGYKFNNKRSRAVCYKGEHTYGSRGATRTREAALACLQAWSYEWFNSLSEAERQGFTGSSEPATKRGRKA